MFVEEIDVIIAVSIWLSKNGWCVKSISIPNNQKQSRYHQKEKLINALTQANLNIAQIEINASGPDIVAQKLDGEKLWKIECKGFGTGVIQTLKNNFDRAIASTVSYYDQEDEIQIGIALPHNKIYLEFIEKKIPKPLRKVTSMWIILYDKENESVKVISPE